MNLICGDSLEVLRGMEAESVQCCVTSPPYWGLRDYGTAGQLGLERTPDEYVARMVEVFREVRRVLKKDGTLWLNIGDSYAANRTYQVTPTKWPSLPQGQSAEVPPGLKPKDLVGIPWMLAFALRADGWWLRQDIIWSKPNPMPESVTDRCTKAHEYVFLLSQSARYFYDAEAVSEPAAPESASRYNYDFIPTPEGAVVCPGDEKEQRTRPNGHREFTGTRNKRSVWHIATQPFSEAHFATMPPALAEVCIKAGTKPGDTVLDPFAGAGTTLLVADRLGRHGVGIDLNAEYVEIARRRIAADAPLFNEGVL